MTLCYACTHRMGEHKCSFYQFPRDEKKLKEWIEMIRRGGFKPKYKSLRPICSCHFVKGKKVNGPTIFDRKDDPITKNENSGRGRGIRRKILKVVSSSETETDDELLQRLLPPKHSQWPKSSDGRLFHPGPSDAQPQFVVRHNQPTQGPSVVSGSRPAVQSAVIYPTAKEVLLEQELAMAKRRIEVLESDLTKEKNAAKNEIGSLKVALDKAKLGTKSLKTAGNVLSFNSLLTNFNLFHYYTGLPSYYVFELFLEWLKNVGFRTKARFPLEDQLLLTLVKLRLNPDFTDLGVRFQMDRVTARRIFFPAIEALHSVLFPLVKFPTTPTSQDPTSVPASFRRYLTCKCIIDTVEIKCAAFRSSLDRQTQTPPDRYTNSFKGLIACTPSGTVTYASKLFPNSITDVELLSQDGFIHSFVDGDVILANRKFSPSVTNILPPGVTITTSSFFKGEKSTETEPVRARIPTDVVISRMKSYKIFDSFFLPCMKKHNTIMFQLIACLMNLHPSLLQTDVPIIDADAIEQDQPMIELIQ